jgi:hypothetical protein
MLHIWHFQARESADMMQEQHNCGVATNIFALAFHGISRKTLLTERIEQAERQISP